MLFQVGGQGSRLTFFEMSAALQLPSSLRSALSYSLGVMALRRPILHKVVDYEDEFFALLMLVLETHSVRTTDSSFTESLCGLRRRAVKSKMKKDDLHSDSTDGIQLSGLEKLQRVLSVVFLICFHMDYIASFQNSLTVVIIKGSFQLFYWLCYHILSQSCFQYMTKRGILHCMRVGVS